MKGDRIRSRNVLLQAVHAFSRPMRSFDTSQIDASSLNASDTIAPAVVSLPRGGWLIQWLEGRPGARRVLARAFNDKLEPVGLPVEIASQSGIQDTPGALVVRENRVLSVHYAQSERGYEIWAAVLRCG